jgi:zinc finger CCHC domain-containing protein 9
MLQSADGGTAASFLGTGNEAGADEDDFHMIRRRNLEIDEEEREEAKALRAGALAGVVKTSGGTSFKAKRCVLLNP